MLHLICMISQFAMLRDGSWMWLSRARAAAVGGDNTQEVTDELQEMIDTLMSKDDRVIVDDVCIFFIIWNSFF